MTVTGFGDHRPRARPPFEVGSLGTGDGWGLRKGPETVLRWKCSADGRRREIQVERTFIQGDSDRGTSR